jgi:hypothetical protein
VYIEILIFYGTAHAYLHVAGSSPFQSGRAWKFWNQPTYMLIYLSESQVSDNGYGYDFSCPFSFYPWI